MKAKFETGTKIRFIKGKYKGEAGIITSPIKIKGCDVINYIISSSIDDDCIQDELWALEDEIDLDSNYPPLPKKDYSYTEEMYLKDIQLPNTISDISKAGFSFIDDISDINRSFYRYYFNAQRNKYKYRGIRNTNGLRIYPLPFIISDSVKLGNILITSHSFESSEPHIHLYKKELTPNTIREGCAISLLYPCYYQHDGNHREKLSKEDMDKIIEYFSKNNFEIWKAYLDEWNYSNENGIKIPLDYPMPMYHYNMPTIIERNK